MRILLNFVPKVIGILSCGFTLCVGLSPAAEAAIAVDELKIDHAARQSRPVVDKTQGQEREGGHSQGGKTIKSEGLRVEGTNCFVQGREEKEGRLRIDNTISRARNISSGIQDDDNFRMGNWIRVE